MNKPKAFNAGTPEYTAAQYKKSLTQSFRAITPEEIESRLAGSAFHVTRKYDGIMVLLFWDGTGIQAFTSSGNPIETVPCFTEAAAALKTASLSEAVIAAELYACEKTAKTALIGQTTISEEEYRAIGGGIKKYFPDLEIIQTICAATKDRQDSLRRLLDKVDAVVVAGGRESANTRRLLTIAREGGKTAVLVESPREIPAGFAAYKTVGLCAGASTPDTVIDAIERALTGMR
jgi:4-hydroxy-3-methylbut-2-enyl diphosphate reductase IspH